MSYRLTSLSYRFGEIGALLDTIALAVRNIDDVGEKKLASYAGNIGDSIDLAAHLLGGIHDEVARLTGAAFNHEHGEAAT